MADIATQRIIQTHSGANLKGLPDVCRVQELGPVDVLFIHIVLIVTNVEGPLIQRTA